MPIRDAPRIALPKYFVTVPRGAPARTIALLESTIGVTLADFGTLARAAERQGRTHHAHAGVGHRRVVVLGTEAMIQPPPIEVWTALEQ